jgi:hypothetical protein
VIHGTHDTVRRELLAPYTGRITFLTVPTLLIEEMVLLALVTDSLPTKGTVLNLAFLTNFLFLGQVKSRLTRKTLLVLAGLALLAILHFALQTIL